MYFGGPLLHYGVALLLALPLLYAAASKALDPSRFAAAVPRLGLPPLAALRASARFISLLEGLVGTVLVALPIAATGITAGVIYLTFVGILVRARLKGSRGDCGCFGALAGRIDAVSIGRNIALALGCFGLAYFRAEHWLATYTSEVAIAVVAAIVVASAAADTVLEIRRR